MGKTAKQLERIWENILSAFGVEKEDEVTDADRKKQEALTTELNRLEYEYRRENGMVTPNFEELVPKTLGLKEKEYTPRTEESMIVEAKKELQSDDEKNRRKLAESKENAVVKADGMAAQAQTVREQETAAAVGAAINAAENAKNRAVRQGVVDSSIYESDLRSVADTLRQEESEIKLRYDEGVRAAREKREQAEADYQSAMRAYELKYAEKLEKNLAKLQAEERKKQAEADEYNRKIAEREREYQTEGRVQEIARRENAFEKELAKRLEQERAAEQSVGYTPAKEASLVDRYLAADSYYSQMSPEAAKKLIGENSAFLSEMLVAYFSTLVDKYRKL